jgi:transcriptional regulator with XRE-family HTH domain
MAIALKLARTVARLTQTELARRAGLDNSTISLIESGKLDVRGLGYEKVVRIAQVLGVPAEQLFPVAPFVPSADPEVTSCP